MCFFKFPILINALSHTSHLYGFVPVCTLTWLFRVPDSPNAFPHTWHLYGFSPLWILLCTARCSDFLNRLSQTLHSNGLSPEWISLWVIRLRLHWKHFPHSVHLYLLLWPIICCLRYDWQWNRFSHWVHEYQLSSVCLLLCLLKWDLSVNRLSHTVHTYGLGLSSRGCSVISLASVFISVALPAHTQHKACRCPSRHYMQTEAQNNIALQPKPVLRMFECTCYDHNIFRIIRLFVSLSCRCVKTCSRNPSIKPTKLGSLNNKKFNYRRGTARRSKSAECRRLLQNSTRNRLWEGLQ